MSVQLRKLSINIVHQGDNSSVNFCASSLGVSIFSSVSAYLILFLLVCSNHTITEYDLFLYGRWLLLFTGTSVMIRNKKWGWTSPQGVKLKCTTHGCDYSTQVTESNYSLIIGSENTTEVWSFNSFMIESGLPNTSKSIWQRICKTAWHAREVPDTAHAKTNSRPAAGG